MKETERIVRAYEEATKEVLQAMSNGFIGIEPDKQTRARRSRIAAKLDRIRKRYLPIQWELEEERLGGDV